MLIRKEALADMHVSARMGCVLVLGILLAFPDKHLEASGLLVRCVDFRETTHMVNGMHSS